MTIKRKSFGGGTFPHELVGKRMEIISSRIPELVGVAGKIIDETRSTLTLAIGEKTKKILKNTIVFKLESGEVVHGELLNKRPEERIKG
jgi:ribonuclease P protein subunit POP4